MKKRNVIITALVGLAVLTGAECGEDPRNPGSYSDEGGKDSTPKDKRPTCPEVEFRAPYERCFTIQTYVETKYAPYVVYIVIHGGNGAYPPEVPIASGGWKHGVVYKSGEKLTIEIEVKPSRAGSKDGFCSITDGAKFAKAEINGAWKAHCTLTTQQ
jgi:hypothetical protein